MRAGSVGPAFAGDPGTAVAGEAVPAVRANVATPTFLQSCAAPDFLHGTLLSFNLRPRDEAGHFLL